MERLKLNHTLLWIDSIEGVEEIIQSSVVITFQCEIPEVDQVDFNDLLVLNANSIGTSGTSRLNQ
jgi:hypothetical protein